MLKQTTKMHSTSFAISLVVLFFHSSIAVQTNDLKNLELPQTLNKYASPQLYVFGGFDESKTGSSRTLSSASQFNSSTGEWKRTTRMSMKRSFFCGAVVGTKIYLFGGSADPEYSETAEVYDCETGIYSPFRSMSSARDRCGAAVLDGSIYVAGGLDDSSLASVIRYNIHTTRIENVSPMHNARSNFQLVELNGRLYAIGGAETKTVEMYNSTTDQWSMMASTHYEHTGLGAAVHEGKIYIGSQKGFEVYTPEADQWETLTSLNNYAGRALVSMNGELWALGGNTGSKPATKSVFTYNTTTKQWAQQPDMDLTRKYFTAFLVNH